MRRSMLVVLAALVIVAATIFIGCSDEEESSISITSLTANPTTVLPGGSSTISATVDYEGDGSVSYDWSCDDGTISGTSNSVMWIAPSDTGSYTISLTVSDGDVSDNGDVTIEVLPENTRGTVILINGSLNGVSVEDGILGIDASASSNINGTVSVETNNLYAASSVAPLVIVWSWGSHERSYSTIDGWIPIGTSNYDIPIDLTAPSIVGTYYITISFAGEMNGGQIASLTN